MTLTLPAFLADSHSLGLLARRCVRHTPKWNVLEGDAVQGGVFPHHCYRSSPPSYSYA